MKRCCILLLAAMSAFAVQAQDIDARASLMGSEMNDFDSFINDADREFTGFLLSMLISKCFDHYF